MLGSVVKLKKKYYTQTLLEECKYETKKTKIENLISDDLEWSSTDNKTESDSNDESDNKPKKVPKKSDNETDDESDNEASNEIDNES